MSMVVQKDVKNPIKSLLKATTAFTALKSEIEEGLKTNILSLHYDRDEKYGHVLTVRMTWAANMTPDDIDTSETK